MKKQTKNLSLTVALLLCLSCQEQPLKIQKNSHTPKIICSLPIQESIVILLPTDHATQKLTPNTAPKLTTAKAKRQH